MKVIKTEIYGKLVIGIVFENGQEHTAMRLFANDLTLDKIETLALPISDTTIIDKFLWGLWSALNV